MKAYLPLPEMPESCVLCDFCDYTYEGYNEMYCKRLAIDDCVCPKEGRHPSCPLRLAEEGGYRMTNKHIWMSGTSEVFVRKVLEQYQKDCDKLAKLFPCTYCGRVKYLLTDNGLEKACEETCEIHKTWRDLGAGIMTRPKAMQEGIDRLEGELRDAKDNS